MKRYGSIPVRTLLVLTVITGLVVTMAMLPFSFASNSASAKSVERGSSLMKNKPCNICASRAIYPSNSNDA